jgi:hypothetical protein
MATTVRASASKIIHTASKYGMTKRTFAAAAASDEPLVKTALYDMHKELGGDMVPFAGYELPVLYKGENGGVMKEHLWCREEGKAALFDVSHMGQVGYSSVVGYPQFVNKHGNEHFHEVVIFFELSDPFLTEAIS